MYYLILNIVYFFKKVFKTILLVVQKCKGFDWVNWPCEVRIWFGLWDAAQKKLTNFGTFPKLPRPPTLLWTTWEVDTPHLRITHCEVLCWVIPFWRMTSTASLIIACFCPGELQYNPSTTGILLVSIQYLKWTRQMLILGLVVEPWVFIWTFSYPPPPPISPHHQLLVANTTFVDSVGWWGGYCTVDHGSCAVYALLFLPTPPVVAWVFRLTFYSFPSPSSSSHLQLFVSIRYRKRHGGRGAWVFGCVCHLVLSPNT